MSPEEIGLIELTQRMDTTTAQSELRHAYVSGGPGTIVSGVIWLTAAVIEAYVNIPTAFGVLFFGGMLIFPATKIILLTFCCRKAESASNPGKLIVVETIFPMIAGLFAAWLILPHRPEFVFPVAAVSVGAHYFGFRTAYGDWTFWVLGAILCSVGIASVLFNVPARSSVPFATAGIEIAFGAWFIFVDTKEANNRSAD